MSRRRPPKPRRLGGKAPEESLLLRLARAFAENLSGILKVALLVGFVAILDPLLSKIERYVDAGEAAPHAAIEQADFTPVHTVEEPTRPEALPTDPELDKNWKHHLKCTSDKSYRDENFDACFPEGTVVYERPKANEGDGSFLFELDRDTLYAAR